MSDDLAGLLTDLRAFAALLPWRLERCVAFGSRVRGDHTRWSDLDVLLIARDFDGIPFERRIAAVMAFEPAWQGGCALEVVCLTPAEVERKLSYGGLVRDALRDGVDVLAAAPADATPGPQGRDPSAVSR